MLKIEKTVLPSPEQWEIIIEGMRNPKNSWDKSDGHKYVVNWDDVADYDDCPEWGYDIGVNNHQLMMQLAKGGAVHAKYRRMITVFMTINAPLYWWKEFDTYKVGTVANSCSTMHKIHSKEFTLDDFSHEHLLIDEDLTSYAGEWIPPKDILGITIDTLNCARSTYLATKDKKYWWQMIQLLPSSYNQRRTVELNYEVLAGIYPMRKDHKLDEWHVFCDWIKSLPYSEIIIGEEK
jgi:hypothetical protein